MTTADSAAVTTSYIGDSVTVTDQTGKKRKSVTDALGRLREVYEDPNGLNYLTSYAYDVLDDLTTVTQGTQTRSFVYDSLKRLTSATNPESGTITYQYDNNGNLIQKTDARAVSITYVYDALNRNTRVDYSDTTGINPDLSRFYDGATNGKGRFWYNYGGGNYSTGSNVEHTAIDSYDALGRPTVQRQLSKLNGTWGPTYQIQRGYNLAGGVTTQTYPSGRTVSYSYDNAGRTSSFSGNLGDGVTRTYSTGMIYSPLGGMAKEQFGTDTALYSKSFYNSRGQLSEIRVGTYHATDESWWNRGAIINHYSNNCWGMCGGESSTQSMTDNNGNLKKQEVFIPHNDQITSYTTWWQGYDYDNLNRLQRVHEYTGNPSLDLQQEYFDYGRWGNRRIDPDPAKTYRVNNLGSEVETGTNRLYSPGDLVLPDASRRMRYDNAGNLIKDTYTGVGDRTYDAENRMTQAWANSLWQVYTYNADGQRARRKVNGIETWQIYGMDGDLLAEYAANAAAASPQKEYGYRNGQLLITASGTTVNVAWTNAVGIAVSGNGLTKTAAEGWGNAGAASTQALVSGDGYVEFTANETNTYRMCGLSNGDSNQNYTDIDFALYPATSGALHIYEAGVNRGQFGTYAAGDRLRVAVEGGVVKYRKNGTLLYTSGVNPTYPLLADTSLYTSAATLINVVLSGNLSGGNGSSINWLVVDHLGTPRMIIDKTGTLTNVKRRDYLPFGEELYATQGLRSTTLGYTGDNMRQKFTSYERDNETDLDYAGARYYVSKHGRFTTPDPLTASAITGNPQTFNRYTYALNSPQTHTDPTGMLPVDQAPGGLGPGGDEGGGGGGARTSGGTEEIWEIPYEREVREWNAWVATLPQNPPQEALITSGTAEAADRLKIKPCATFFGGTKKGLEALESLNFDVDPTMDPSGHPQAEIQGNNVKVNPNGGLMTPDGGRYTFILVERTKSANSTRTLTLFGVEARAFGQLHETGHKAKRFGKTDNDLGRGRVMNNYQNNFKIWKACFSGTPTQPWRGQPPLIP